MPSQSSTAWNASPSAAPNAPSSRTAERQIEAAHRALARAPLEPHTREELTELARFVVEREF
jgi:geranylgeranyl pyrophosphate synthase